MNENGDIYEDNISAWSESPAPIAMEEQLENEVRRSEELEEQLHSMTETIYSLEEETCKAIELEAHVKEVETDNARLMETFNIFRSNVKDVIDQTWPEGQSDTLKLCEQIDDFTHLLKSFMDEMDLDEDDDTASKEDVLWFVKELSLRFEQITAMEYHHRNNSKNSFLQLLHHQTQNGHSTPPQNSQVAEQEEIISLTQKMDEDQLGHHKALAQNDLIEQQEEKIKLLEESVQGLTQQLQQSQLIIETNDQNHQSHQHQQIQQMQSSKQTINSLESALKSMHLEYNSLKKRRSNHNQHQEEIVQLATALEKSELQRATLLEGFQKERNENAQNLQMLMEKFQNFVTFNDFRV